MSFNSVNQKFTNFFGHGLPSDSDEADIYKLELQLETVQFLSLIHEQLDRIANELSERNRIERLRNNIYGPETDVMKLPPDPMPGEIREL